VEGAVIIEAKTYPLFDELWVTTFDKEEAVIRVMQRNPNLTETLARARVYSQIDDTERLKYASWSYNTGSAYSFDHNKVLID